MDSFLNLQNGFYNALSQGLGFSPGSPFQLFQPSTPLLPGNNQALWMYFNNIPPFSLTQNYVASAGNQFFSDYQGMMSALQGPPNNFEQDVGEVCFNAWISYVTSLNPAPSPNQLPTLFRNWAMIRYPSVAVRGASDLSAMLLDPISAGQLALMPYQNGTPPDWSLGYDALVNQLSVAPSRSFDLSSSSMNSDVSNSWTQGGNSGFFGLWGGSSYQSSESQTFASSGVTVSASFAHVMTFVASPGNWYNSSAMGEAYSQKSGVPWNPQSPINWGNTFDPKSGNMARFAANLIVADTMRIQVTSLATFNSDQQTTIRNNSSAGMWPFYCKGSSSGAHTEVSFNNNGQMTVLISSQPGVPVVIGVNVLSAGEFVGHAVEGAKLVRK
ncbi:hypothetical protein [Chitinivorax sp. B]|uniref:hypothetical protein n=1 Tax=Chitinivorax sp. B TaxID=2502235 RepID=UPI0010F50FB2|nr:hypothetical protein [Chitinivorax sp. B]